MQLFIVVLTLVVAIRCQEDDDSTAIESSEDFEPPFLKAPRPKKIRKGMGVCTNEKIRKLMHENMTDSMSDSKRDIHEATKNLGGTWAVICAECPFSYVAHAQDYCIHSRFNITCLVYKEN